MEIIQQHDDAPSAYNDFLSAGHEGVQHLCSWYSDSPAYELARSRLISEGLLLMQKGLAACVNARFAYFSQPGKSAWPQVEVSEGLVPSMMPIVDRLQALNLKRDGSNPILEGPDALFAATL